jgi:hypothetical protein
MERVEADLGMDREEGECVRQIFAEEELQSKRMEKVDRLKRAWQLKMNARRFQRMVTMMVGLTVDYMGMEMEWIETKITEMMEVEDQVKVETKEWLEDRDGDMVMHQVEVTEIKMEEYM